MCHGKRVFSIVLIIAFMIGLVGCGGNHIVVPAETGDYTVNYHDSVTLTSIEAKVEFSDFSVENLADNKTADLSFYITLYLPDETKPATYATWLSDFNIGTNETDYELVSKENDTTGEYFQIQEDSDELSDSIIYHVFCSTELSEITYSLTCSVNDDLNFEFVISSNDVGTMIFENAEKLFGNEQYDSALSYYELIAETQKDQADKRIQSIKCLDVIESLNTTIEDKYNTTNDFWGQYMDSLFNTSISATGSYDVVNYTYNLKITFSSIFSNVAGIFGASLGDVVGNSGGMQGTQAKESYEIFRNAGFDNITCCVQYCDYEGNIMETDTYSLSDYEKDESSAKVKIQEISSDPNNVDITINSVAGEYVGKNVGIVMDQYDAHRQLSVAFCTDGTIFYDAAFGNGFCKASGYSSGFFIDFSKYTDTELEVVLERLYDEYMCSYIFLDSYFVGDSEPGTETQYRNYDMLYTILETMESIGLYNNQDYYIYTGDGEEICVDMAQLEAIGRDNFTYAKIANIQQADISDNALNDFGTIEGTYHMAHNYSLQMGLWFESDMTGLNSSNWQASEPMELHFQLNDSYEILGDGVAYWWPRSEGLPFFEGNLNSSHDPITIEYDGYNFIVTCSALDLYEASFFKD